MKRPDLLTSNQEPCKLHPIRYVYDMQQTSAVRSYYVTVPTKKTRDQAYLLKINRILSGKDYTCTCPRCSTATEAFIMERYHE